MSKKGKAVWVALLAALIGTLTVSAQVRKDSDEDRKDSDVVPVYDNFNSRWLDPSKWVPTANCWNGLPLECVREIQNGQLRLAIRSFGASNSDSGDLQTASFLLFANPTSIRSITATVTVVAAVEGPCATNPFVSTAKASLDGVFFNTGTGSYLDDVHAAFVLGANPYLDPSTLDVGGWIGDGHGLNIWTHIGYYPRATRLRVTLAWDQPNHQFVFTIKPREGIASQVSVPYGVSDSYPAVGPSRQLSAVSDPPNCTSATAASSMEALFDNVIVK